MAVAILGRTPVSKPQYENGTPGETQTTHHPRRAAIDRAGGWRKGLEVADNEQTSCCVSSEASNGVFRNQSIVRPAGPLKKADGGKR